ncbi:DUF1971 domain-containing protein [Serratia sp. L9]|uniref:DUF1971 domain-containing protein n=1 Tax=Serratia sp. L9 TaxID=3423946 RepID=UPI003D67E939
MRYRIPADYKHTRSTPFWDQNTVPKALLTHHNTKKGVYGRLSVMRGAVKYMGFNAEHEAMPEWEVTISAGQFGVSPPEYWHRIELLTADTYFNLDFFAAPGSEREEERGAQRVNSPR